MARALHAAYPIQTYIAIRWQTSLVGTLAPTPIEALQPRQRPDSDHQAHSRHRQCFLTPTLRPSQGRPCPFLCHGPPPYPRAQPTPKSSGEYISASSASSYPPSQASTLTLSSTADGSSASSALFDKNSRDQQPTDLINVQLKKLYREISDLENKIKADDAGDSAADDMSRSTLKGKGKGKYPNPIEEDGIERDKWRIG